jgi:hypothetical protein
MPGGVYIYGIVRERRPRQFGFTGIGGAAVYTINHENLAAVVSDTGLAQIDPNRQNVRAHTVVQGEVLLQYTLLPVVFGMVAAGRQDVSRLLEANCRGLSAELRRLAGKIEVELKVFWEQEAVLREVQGRSPELARLKAKVNTAVPPSELRELLIEAGRLVEGIVQDWKARYAELVYVILRELAYEAKVNRPLGITNLLNASFLIDRPQEVEFREQVFRLDARFQGKMNFKYAGPLPLYNFVSLKLNPVNADIYSDAPPGWREDLSNV